MFARTIYSISALIGVICLAYGFWYEHEIAARFSIPFVVIAAIFYVMSPQVNWWWYNKNPDRLDPELKAMFASRLPFYKNLSAEDKTKFETRVNLFLMAKEFIPKIREDVPEDVKAIIAASAVQLTFNREEFLFDKFEQFVIYTSPFPTPQYETWHICEHYEEDGAVLFSAEHLLYGFFEPHKYYHIALHEYANIFTLTYPNEAYPELTEKHWDDFYKMSNFTEDKIKKYVGLSDLKPLSVGITFFFTHPEQFKKVLPEEYEAFNKIFK